MYAEHRGVGFPALNVNLFDAWTAKQRCIKTGNTMVVVALHIRQNQW